MNMLATIVPKSDQINADDLIGKTMTITVNEVKFSGGTEQPVSMYFDGSDKAFRPCKSMCRVLVATWGPDAKAYVGRSMTLYRDPDVKWGGMKVGGIRISHMSDIDGPRTMALTETKGSRKPFKVMPLVAPQINAPPADKVAEGVATLLSRIEACTEAADVMAIVTDPAVIKQRAWLGKNRIDHARQVDEAVTTALDNAGSCRSDADTNHGDAFDGTDGAPATEDRLDGGGR